MDTAGKNSKLKRIDDRLEKFQVTPGVLQLVSHSKVLAEMVNLHFLSLMEALMECHSTILVKLMPLWTPVLFAYQVVSAICTEPL